MTYQLASSLVTAAGSRVSEVRITRLAEMTYYAVVVLDGATGPTEVDARPSDALNLALVAQSPIRVDARVLEQGGADHAGWDGSSYPTGAAELVAEVRQRQEELMATMSEQRKGGCSPSP
jgi:bifunctional DNase/RNase